MASTCFGTNEPLSIAGEAYVALLYALTLGLDAKLVYEVGVRKGYSTRAILEALAKTGGRLVSCDVDDCHSAVEDRELRARWTFYHTDCRQFSDLLTNRADLIYLDGCHEIIRTDAVNFWPLLRVGGLMVLHDAELENVSLALEQLQSECQEVIEIPFARRFGIIRKHKRDPNRLEMELT